MSQQEALRLRFAETETEALMTMWRTQERLPWAEEILHAELLARGADSSELHRDVGDRESLPGADSHRTRNTIVGYFLGRFGVVVFAVATSRMLDGLLGPPAGVLGALCVLLIFLIAVFRRLLQPGAHSGLASVAIVYMWIEASVLTLVAAYGVLSFLI